MSLNSIIKFCFVTIACSGCKEMYKPDIISSDNSYLVVEGVLNAGNGPASIRITRSFKLDDTARLQGERHAQVTVEDRNNNARTMTMTTDGVYTSAGLNLTYNEDYRLRIRTAGGKEYLSDFVTAVRTPVIDSIGFRQNEEGVQVYVNAYDATGNTRYYRWDYDETWEIRSYYYSLYKYVNNQVVERMPTDNVYVCWKYNNSKNIIVGSTASLASDAIIRKPISFIPNGAEQLAIRYSILLRQYAMDKKGYEFFELMKKNTESLGTIFDAQPSEIRGNIQCISDPGEPVIGYITASSIEEQRYFINTTQLANWRFFEDCPSTLIPNNPDSIKAAYDGGLSIYTAEFGTFGVRPISYYFSYKKCVECTARGGDLQKPSYW